MKRPKRKPRDLVKHFQSTCGWCGRTIPADSEVFGGGGRVRPDIDLSDKAGQVMPIRLVRAGKTVLVAVSAMNSQARREGHDFMYMTCSQACAQRLKEAFQADIDFGKLSGSG